MRRMFAAALMAVVAFGFAPGHADEPYTDTDCAHAQGEGGGPTVHTWMGSDEEGRPEPLRGAVCVNDGQLDREDDPDTEPDESSENNGAELYVGGEIDTEASEDFLCGSIEVAGMKGTGYAPEVERPIFGEDNWGGSDCQ